MVTRRRELSERDGSQGDTTYAAKGTSQGRHDERPKGTEEGLPGPGSFIGAENTKGHCPVKLEFAFQSHESSPGEQEGKPLAWEVGAPDASGPLLRLLLGAARGGANEQRLDHGHGAEGAPGDCLLEEDELCDACVAHTRSTMLVNL